mgnify:CR=1 FL=1
MSKKICIKLVCVCVCVCGGGYYVGHILFLFWWVYLWIFFASWQIIIILKIVTSEQYF